MLTPEGESSVTDSFSVALGWSSDLFLIGVGWEWWNVRLKRLKGHIRVQYRQGQKSARKQTEMYTKRSWHGWALTGLYPDS